MPNTPPSGSREKLMERLEQISARITAILTPLVFSVQRRIRKYFYHNRNANFLSSRDEIDQICAMCDKKDAEKIAQLLRDSLPADELSADNLTDPSKRNVSYEIVPILGVPTFETAKELVALLTESEKINRELNFYAPDL